MVRFPQPTRSDHKSRTIGFLLLKIFVVVLISLLLLGMLGFFLYEMVNFVLALYYYG